MDQVRFELKCTPRYLTVCSRDNASPLVRESGRWGEEAFRTLSLADEKSVVSTPGYKAMKVFIQALLINTIVVGIAKHEIISIL